MDYLAYKAEDFAADDFFLAYYFKSDSEAVAFWENWIRTHPEKLDEIMTAERLLELLSGHLSAQEREQERQRLLATINAPQTVLPLPRRIKYWAIAASVLVVLGIFLGGLAYFRPSTPVSTPVEWVQHTNPNGKKSKLTLSDGSVVILNAASTIRYPKTFTDQKRTIELTGEAYFTVTHDAKRPFTVQTGTLTTEVLGTEFNVSAYEPQREISVSLIRGKVNVREAMHQLLLTPGQQATFSSRKLIRTNFDEAAVTGWKDNRLVFINADFQTIVKSIERTYGYTVINQSTAQHWRYTGTFDREDVRSVIENICFSKHLNYTVTQQTIYLSDEK